MNSSHVVKQMSQIQDHSFQNMIYLRTRVFPGPNTSSEMYPNNARHAGHTKFKRNLLFNLTISKNVEGDPECVLQKRVLKSPIYSHLLFSDILHLSPSLSPFSPHLSVTMVMTMTSNEYDEVTFMRCLFCSIDYSK